jgi:hypothetical protein
VAYWFGLAKYLERDHDRPKTVLVIGWLAGCVPSGEDSHWSRYLTITRKNGFNHSASDHCASGPDRHHVRTLEHVQPILVFQVLMQINLGQNLTRDVH